MNCSRVSVAFLVLSLFAYLSTSGCSMIKSTMPPFASVEGVSTRFSAGQIIHVETGKAISFDQLIDQLGSTKVIFIGEIHNNPEHHLIQVQILQSLMSRYGPLAGPLAVGMEFFQVPQQEALDRYVRGDVPEERFLNDVGWHKEWSFDYHLYRPLMLMIKEKGGEILAINAPNQIVRKVARSGLVSLKPSERAQLARQIDLNNERHRLYLREVYSKHSQPDLKRFDYFYQAQCVWEETMAENIAVYLKEHNKRLVVFTGNGHIIKKFGIPDRTLRRMPVTMATIVPCLLIGQVNLERQDADYVWLTRAYP